MSFHKILKNPELRKKWVRLLKRKGIRDPGPRVCSAHLVGGTKTYSNNIPTIFATATTRKPRKSPTTRKMDNKNPVIAEQFTLENTSQDSSVIDDSSTTDDNSENTVQDLKNKISSLQAQNMALSTKYDEDVASDSDFKFYTGFPNYSCFKAFYNYLSPACEHLLYHGSNTAPIRDGPLFFWRGDGHFVNANKFFWWCCRCKQFFLHLLPSANNFFCPSNWCGFHYKLIYIV
jgi:hypothetical protein